MELYVIRHAIAEALGQRNDFSDEKRSLTEEGRSRMREASRGLKKLGVDVELLLTSPLVRAVETAEIVASAIGLGKKEIRQTPRLAPGTALEEVLSELKSHVGAESIALVGHQPDLGILISSIIQSAAPSIQLKKGGACCVNVIETVPALRGDLVWLLTPRQLRLISRA